MKITTIIIAIGFLLPTLVLAKDIGMVTGSSGGTYYPFGKDIARVSKQEGVDIEVKTSKGSIDNITRLASKENAAFAIVQSDVLGHLKKSTSPKLKRYAEKLRMIYPFYNEEIHLFANKSIKSIDDLNGKRVVVGSDGSGTNMTVENLMNIMGVKPKKAIYESPKKGIMQVVLGRADAVFYVSGKPVKYFENLFDRPDDDLKQQLSKVHFVPLDDAKILIEYVPADISPQDYNIVTKKIPTIAVKAMLVSFDFSSSSSKYYVKRCQQLHKIGRAIKNNLAILRQTGHKKWNNVDLEATVGDWEIDKCSHGLSDNTPEIVTPDGRIPDSSDTLEKRLECRLEGGKWRNEKCIK